MQVHARKSENSRSPQWSDQELETLTRLYAKDMSNAKIAVELGRAESAVAVKVTRLGFPNRATLRRDARSAAPRFKVRRCLCCRTLFFSAHSGNRMCDSCRGASDNSSDYVIQIGAR